MCRIAYYQGNPIEPRICDVCRMTAERYLQDNPEIMDSGHFESEKEAVLYFRQRLAPIFVCHEHDVYLCGMCKDRHIIEVLEENKTMEE